MGRVLIILSSIFLGIGLVAPTMTIIPSAGDLSWLVKIIDPQSMDIISYSIAGIIFELSQAGDWFLAIVLSLFSILFPVTKLYFFWVASSSPQEKEKIHKITSIASKLSKFSMAEVFVLSLALISLKTLPGGTDVTIEYGCVIYFLSVIFSILASMKLNPR